jgi:hypothetical protein
MKKSIVLLAAGSAFAIGAASFASNSIKFHDDDIIWPTYVLVTKSYDAKLTCTRLRAEIAYVESDIRLLVKARLKAEQALRTSYDTQTSMGREQAGAFLNTATNKAGFSYVEARDQIRESRRVAELRRDHLNELLPNCVEPPTP